MEQKTESRTGGHLAAAFTVLIWGTTFISTKILLKGLSPAEVLFFRFLTAYLALWIACPRPLKLTERKHEWYFIGAGLFGITLYYLLENVALTYTLASNAGVIISVTPFFTGMISHFFLREERLKPGFFLGFAVAFTGIFFISFNGVSSFHLNPLGDILEILAALAWSTYSVFSKKFSSWGYNSLQVTRRTFFYGLVFMIPAMFFMDFGPELEAFADPAILLNLLYLGLGASAVCYVSWNLAVKRLGAVKTSVYIYLVPVVTVAASALILKEPVSSATVLGTVMTVSGLVISEGRLSSKRQTTV